VFVPVNDAPDGQQHDQPENPGIFALDIATGRGVWAAPSPTDTCKDLPLCWRGYTQAITVTPELVFAGSSDGWTRIFDADSGAVLWQYDTRQVVETVNGIRASGGSMGGAAAPIAFDGSLYVPAGYGFGGQMPGNVLLAFGTDDGRTAKRSRGSR
jgi:polyvinyl alcohol dehydrogenase (cytochrome)